MGFSCIRPSRAPHWEALTSNVTCSRFEAARGGGKTRSGRGEEGGDERERREEEKGAEKRKRREIREK